MSHSARAEILDLMLREDVGAAIIIQPEFDMMIEERLILRGPRGPVLSEDGRRIALEGSRPAKLRGAGEG